MVVTVCYFRKIDVIAVWFKNGSNKNYNLKLKDTTSKRRKRSQVPMYIGEIYESYELMEAAVDKNGEFEIFFEDEVYTVY